MHGAVPLAFLSVLTGSLTGLLLRSGRCGSILVDAALLAGAFFLFGGIVVPAARIRTVQP